MAPSDNGFFDKAKTLTPLQSGPQPVTGVTPNSGASIDPVSKMSNTEKLRRTVEYALSLRTLTDEARRALGELLNPENLAIAAGVMVVWAASHFFGVGEVVDVILVGVAYATLGVQGMQGLANLVEFGYDVINAESDFDLRRAADKLARALVALGAEVVMALLLRKAQIKPAGAKDAPSSRGSAPKSEAPPPGPGPGPEPKRLPTKGPANFADEAKLKRHFEDHGKEFGVKTQDEYLALARGVMEKGYKVEYQYKGETRVGFLELMGTTRKGEAKFAFVGTNSSGNITTLHTKSGDELWKLLNGSKDLKVISPIP